MTVRAFCYLIERKENHIKIFYLSERIDMKNLGKKFAILAISGIISLAASVTAFAASSIKSVKINIKSDGITVGKERDINDVTVNVSGSGYSIDEVDFMEMGTAWDITDIPKITVHLSSNDKYYFSVYRSEDFKITGGKFIEARRENSSSDLYVDIELPALVNQVSPIETVYLNNSGQATWGESKGSSGYQVKLMRDNSTSAIGGVQNFITTSANVKNLLTKTGTYTLKVRAISGDGTKFGPWVSSNSITVSQAEAAKNYNEGLNVNLQAVQNNIQTAPNNGQNTQLQGTWQRNNTGWWYVLSDGSYVTYTWKEIDGNWYYFNADGYMLVGWQNINGNWYYLDLNSGKMLVDTTTPDGYYVNSSGAYVAR